MRGSSPLARGLPVYLTRGVHGAGIIPARAGFTPRKGGERRGRQDHPRSRGVYPMASYAQSWKSGSSPLARGLPLNREMLALSRRIIPARAGFTHASRPGRSPGRDHPRSRGVYSRVSDDELDAIGSSPLARGLPLHVLDAEGEGGIIPARAGFTQLGRVPAHVSADHPRSRGVYQSKYQDVYIKPGSSPLARGLHAHRLRHDVDVGIIPARAGFTLSGICGNKCAQDHPRSRGVYRPSSRAMSVRVGSSPLARGLPPP